MVRIITNETPVEELQRDFTVELTEMMKKAALIMGCDVHELRYRCDNMGVVEINRMTPNQIIEAQAADDMAKRIRDIKSSRGMFNV